MTVHWRNRGLIGLLLGLVVSAAVACQARETAREEQVVFDLQHGRYAEGLEKARYLAETNPGDSYSQTLYREAQLAFVLDQGRRDAFRGDLEGALEHFKEAESLDPEHKTVVSWVFKTRAQLADHWLDQASEAKGPESLGDAERAYERVLLYDPENEQARRGLAEVLLLQNYRSGLSHTYFKDGLSSFRRLQLEQARRGFQVSQRYQQNEPASQRGEQVEVLMAEDRLSQAKALEADGWYSAARNEYRLVLLIEPDNVEGRAGLDRMDREARAMRSLAEADMKTRRGELEEAEKTLHQADLLTEAQKDDVSLMKAGIEDRRLEDLYQEARGLYEDYRYPEAVAAYERLLEVAPDYLDARLRKMTIEEFIRLAGEFYAKALAAEDEAEAEEYLRAIHPVIWPEYRDVVERLKVIDAHKAAAEAEAAPPSSGVFEEDEGRR